MDTCCEEYHIYGCLLNQCSTKSCGANYGMSERKFYTDTSV